MSDAPQRGQLFKCPVCKYRGGNPTSVWRDHMTVIHAAAIQDLGLTVDDVNEIGQRCSRSFSFPDIVAAPDVNFLESPFGSKESEIGTTSKTESSAQTLDVHDSRESTKESQTEEVDALIPFMWRQTIYHADGRREVTEKIYLSS